MSIRENAASIDSNASTGHIDSVSATLTIRNLEERVKQYQPTGLLINPVIYAELCTGASAASEVDDILSQLKLEYGNSPGRLCIRLPRLFCNIANEAAQRPRRFLIFSSEDTPRRWASRSSPETRGATKRAFPPCA